MDPINGTLKMKDKAIGSVFESEGLKQIAEALRHRLNSLPMGSSASEKVALSFNLSTLSTEARAVLKTGPGSDPRRAPLFTVLLVGLVTEILPQVKDVVCDLGIDLAILEREWIEELDAALKDTTSALLTKGEYQKARVLSETGNKFLYEPLYWLARSNRAEKPVEAKTAAGRPAFELPPPARASNHRAAPASRVTTAQGRKSQPAQINLRTILAVSVIAACALIAAALHLIQEEPSLQAMRGQEISIVSPHLSSAHRDAEGQGSLVVGKVKAGWAQLSDKERYRAALRMIGALSKQGVRRVMVYDGKQRLQIYFSDGILIRPAQPNA